MGYCYDLLLRNSRIFVKAEDTDSVVHILEESGYETDFDENGNIDGFTSDGSTLRDDDEFYQALAPFMQSGNFLELSNELGDTWRWVFFDGTCKRMNPVMLWPNPDAPPDLSQHMQAAFTQHLMADQ
jgi:hypothetical protein